MNRPAPAPNGRGGRISSADNSSFGKDGMVMAIKSDSYLTSLFGLEGKSIVVTGAGGGIGLAISEGLLRAGAEVALCNRTTAKCKPLADRIIAEGGTASVHQLDVTSLDSIHACG